MNFVRGFMMFCGLTMLGMGSQAYFLPSEGKDPSVMSLVAGGGVGSIIFLMGVLAMKMKSPRVPYIVALVMALLPLGQFVPKLVEGEAEAYPHLLGIALSVSLILVLLGGHLAARKAKTEESA